MKSITIIGILSFVLLIFQLIHEVIDIIYTPLKDSIWVRKYFSWRDIERLADKMVRKIKGSGVQYGLIVGTGRGGGILAALLSYRMDLIPVLVFDRNYIIDDNRNQTLTSLCNIKAFEMNDDYLEIKKKPVLLVTSRSQAGVTLNQYIEVLRNSGFTGNIDKCPFILNNGSVDAEVKYFIAEYSDTVKCRRFP